MAIGGGGDGVLLFPWSWLKRCWYFVLWIREDRGRPLFVGRTDLFFQMHETDMQLSEPNAKPSQHFVGVEECINRVFINLTCRQLTLHHELIHKCRLGATSGKVK